jgi:hypothetical protein
MLCKHDVDMNSVISAAGDLAVTANRPSLIMRRLLEGLPVTNE